MYSFFLFITKNLRNYLNGPTLHLIVPIVLINGLWARCSSVGTNKVWQEVWRRFQQKSLSLTNERKNFGTHRGEMGGMSKLNTEKSYTLSERH